MPMPAPAAGREIVMATRKSSSGSLASGIATGGRRVWSSKRSPSVHRVGTSSE